MQFARQRSEVWGRHDAGGDGAAAGQAVMWQNGINASATYNRSTNAARTMNVQISDSAESFTIAVTAADELAGQGSATTPCYDRALTAANGSVTSDSGAATFTCVFPGNASWCGANLCADSVAATTGSGHAMARLIDEWPPSRVRGSLPQAGDGDSFRMASVLPPRVPSTLRKKSENQPSTLRQ